MKMMERFLSKIKIQKTWTGSGSITINDKVEFFAMRGSSYGIGIELDIKDRSLMFHLLSFYIGVIVFHD